jgi:chondroitin 4-sulfotransferase 11
VSKPYKYIHIPKTAGRSIEKSGLVRKQDWNSHTLLENTLDRESFFTFSLIRNPYDKVLSSYNFYTSKKLKSNSKVASAIKTYGSFNEFILNYDKARLLDESHFYFTQLDYISINGVIKVDYYGDFYNIEKELRKICSLNNDQTRKLNILKLNVSGTSNIWQSYYNKELADIVYEYWEKDFLAFNFDRYSYDT